MIIGNKINHLGKFGSNMKNIFKNKVVLVTGGTGFVGSHLVSKLQKMGAKVVVTYLDLDQSGYFWTQKLDRKTVMARVDVKNFEAIFDLVTRYKVEYVFHLAAQAIVETALVNPRETLETNIVGTINILESSRLCSSVKSVIVASSDKAYGKMANSEYRETDPLRGDHPYDVSKSSADLICHTYFKTYGLPIVTTRFGNIYGEGDGNFSRIIPAILRSVVTRKVLELRSNGQARRDYLYVGDVVEGYILLAKNISKIAGEAYNFGSKENYSVLELIEKVEKSLQIKVNSSILSNAVNEIPNQKLNYEKVLALGWKGSTKISKVIPRIYRWYRQYLK